MYSDWKGVIVECIYECAWGEGGPTVTMGRFPSSISQKKPMHYYFLPFMYMEDSSNLQVGTTHMYIMRNNSHTEFSFQYKEAKPTVYNLPTSSTSPNRCTSSKQRHCYLWFTHSLSNKSWSMLCM